MKIIIILISLILLSGCSIVESTGNVTKEFVCNDPYMQVGSECCLDQNSNRICDKDEEVIGEKQEESIGEEQLKECYAEIEGNIMPLPHLPYCETIKDCEINFAEFLLEIGETDEKTKIIGCNPTSFTEMDVKCESDIECHSILNKYLATNEFPKSVKDEFRNKIRCTNGFCEISKGLELFSMVA